LPFTDLINKLLAVLTIYVNKLVSAAFGTVGQLAASDRFWMFKLQISCQLRNLKFS